MRKDATPFAYPRAKTPKECKATTLADDLLGDGNLRAARSEIVHWRRERCLVKEFKTLFPLYIAYTNGGSCASADTIPADGVPGHDVQRATFLGGKGIKNGKLLDLVEWIGTEAFITCDKSMEKQQVFRARPFRTLMLSTNSWPLIQDHVFVIA